MVSLTDLTSIPIAISATHPEGLFLFICVFSDIERIQNSSVTCHSRWPPCWLRHRLHRRGPATWRMSAARPNTDQKEWGPLGDAAKRPRGWTSRDSECALSCRTSIVRACLRGRILAQPADSRQGHATLREENRSDEQERNLFCKQGTRKKEKGKRSAQGLSHRYTGALKLLFQPI